MSEDKFLKDLFKLINKYPWRFVTVTLTILSTTFVVSWQFHNAIYDNKTYLIESLEKENKRLEEELEKKNIDIQEVQELYSQNIVVQTELEEGHTVSILNGGVIIKARSLYSDYVTYEFSINGKSMLPIEERWKDGSDTERVLFEYKDKTYFIVTENIADDKVTFTVYLSQ